jgi:hypothetical protein
VPHELHMPQRTWNNLLKEAWYEVGRHWADEMRPKHFTKEGGKEYGYKPRAGEAAGGKNFWSSYTGRKQKKFGHTKPLVYTGELEQASRQTTIYPSFKGVRIALPGARKANLQNPRSSIDMPEELKTVSGREVDQLAKVHEQAMQQLLDRVTTTTTYQL